MNQYEKMLRRARKHCPEIDDETEAGKLSRLAFARAIGASQKGCPTFFDGWLKPLPWTLIDEFFDINDPLLLRPGVAAAAGVSLRDAVVMKALAKSLKGDSPWQSPMHPDFGDLRSQKELSMRGERLLAWSRKDDEIRMELSGFRNGPIESGDGLLFVFKGANAKVILKGRLAKLAKQGEWRLAGACWEGVKVKGGFARPLNKLGHDQDQVAFDEIPSIQKNQFSKPSDPKAEIRVSFGHGNLLELAVSGSSVKSVIGRAAIKSFYEGAELDRVIPDAGPKRRPAGRSL